MLQHLLSFELLSIQLQIVGREPLVIHSYTLALQPTCLVVSSSRRCFKPFCMYVDCWLVVESMSQPKIMFYTNQTNNGGGQSTIVVGLEGQTVSMRCFFAGRSV